MFATLEQRDKPRHDAFPKMFSLAIKLWVAREWRVIETAKPAVLLMASQARINNDDRTEYHVPAEHSMISQGRNAQHGFTGFLAGRGLVSGTPNLSIIRS
jgi:hypothetical protein